MNKQDQQESLNIANEIIRQIKAMDFWALGAWGTQEVTAIPYCHKVDRGVLKGDTVRGGVRFKIRTPKYPTATYVNIFLTIMDTYTIEAESKRFNASRGEMIYKTLGSMDDVYAFDLIGAIDSIIEK